MAGNGAAGMFTPLQAATTTVSGAQVQPPMFYNPLGGPVGVLNQWMDAQGNPQHNYIPWGQPEDRLMRFMPTTGSIQPTGTGMGGNVGSGPVGAPPPPTGDIFPPHLNPPTPTLNAPGNGPLGGTPLPPPQQSPGGEAGLTNGPGNGSNAAPPQLSPFLPTLPAPGSPLMGGTPLPPPQQAPGGEAGLNSGPSAGAGMGGPPRLGSFLPTLPAMGGGGGGAAPAPAPGMIPGPVAPSLPRGNQKIGTPSTGPVQPAPAIATTPSWVPPRPQALSGPPDPATTAREWAQLQSPGGHSAMQAGDLTPEQSAQLMNSPNGFTDYYNSLGAVGRYNLITGNAAAGQDLLKRGVINATDVRHIFDDPFGQEKT
jgi:hypothetical protein